MYFRRKTIITLVCVLSIAKAYGDGLRSIDADALRSQLAAGAYGTVTSVLVSHQGKTVFEAYLNGTDSDTLHDTRSVTKTVTGIAAGIATDAGLLTLNQPVARYFAEITPFANGDPRKFNIDLEDLLTMSGPLECDDWNQHSRGNEEKMYIVEDWTRFFWNLPIRGYPSWAPKTRSAPYTRAFSYCTAGVQIIGEAIQRADGKPFTDFVEERLFDPLGISAFEWPRNGQGQAHLGGGLRLRSRDLAKIAQLATASSDHAVVSTDWVRASLRAHTKIPDTDWAYGYLWWLQRWRVGNADVAIAAMNGNGGNRVVVVPAYNLVVVITKTDFNTRGMHDTTDAFFEDQIKPLLIEKRE